MKFRWFKKFKVGDHVCSRNWPRMARGRVVSFPDKNRIKVEYEFTAVTMSGEHGVKLEGCWSSRIDGAWKIVFWPTLRNRICAALKKKVQKFYSLS